LSAPRKRVLVIEDNADLRSLIHAYLEEEGYEVAAASDGREGLQHQRSHPAEIVVTDIFMPGKEGIETVVELKKEFPDTRVIVMSGGPRLAQGMDYLGVARELGASKTLAKPFTMKQLAEAVRELADGA
jgi:DNA-binding response OmpR family regulator